MIERPLVFLLTADFMGVHFVKVSTPWSDLWSRVATLSDHSFVFDINIKRRFIKQGLCFFNLALLGVSRFERPFRKFK